MALPQRACRFPVAGLFAQPTAASERQTEVVYGEIVTPLGDEESGYLPVRAADTYEGWVAARALGAAPAATSTCTRSRATAPTSSG